MPHVIEDVVEAYFHQKPPRKLRTKVPSRETRNLLATLEHYQGFYEHSRLSQTISQLLQAMLRTATVPPTRILSLGLGSLNIGRGQTRRLKQLTILLALRDTLKQSTGKLVEVYAQDPAFTGADEAFLHILGIHILRTPSGSELGEAASIIDHSTIVYSPFLTLEAYEQLLMNTASPVQYLVGDDFNSLLSKWPKRSTERGQVESILKSSLSAYRKRAIPGKDFWVEEDATFPMAMYERAGDTVKRTRKAKL
ncbi:hypothetical protein BKA66DRAFT_478246 [Pyrenochaeta sp. MPI-SDFR-AT-0127]|nr:hypothetical protein BKA66DRAFT_478246 [Pyrenochaeta sp. MPI-SDFR-AT-0127]